MILLTNFAEERGEKPDTVRKYIRRHEEEFEGLFKIDGKQMILSSEAVRLLEKVYPLPKPIEIVEDVETIKALAESRAQLAKAQEVIIQLQQKMNEQAVMLVQAENKMLLLEEVKEVNDALKAENERLNEANIRMQVQNEVAEKELNSYKKTWFGLYRKE